jgi:hypothetical protein
MNCNFWLPKFCAKIFNIKICFWFIKIIKTSPTTAIWWFLDELQPSNKVKLSHSSAKKYAQDMVISKRPSKTNDYF